MGKGEIARFEGLTLKFTKFHVGRKLKWSDFKHRREDFLKSGRVKYFSVEVHLAQVSLSTTVIRFVACRGFKEIITTLP